ncbi:MAG: DsbA family protein [Gemmatimonadales bacterium]
MTSDRIANVAVAILATCAIISTGLLVTNALGWQGVPGVREISGPGSIPLEGRKPFDGLGSRLGDVNRPPKVVVIADFECPYCREFAVGSLRELLESGESALFVHFPLPSHRLAMPLAIASVCADQVGRFEAFHDALFEQQDSIGLKSIEAFATEAGVTDLPQFEECRKSSYARDVVEEEVGLVRQLGVTGTPAVVVGDSVHVGVMAAGLLRARVAAASPVVQ